MYPCSTIYLINKRELYEDKDSGSNYLNRKMREMQPFDKLDDVMKSDLTAILDTELDLQYTELVRLYDAEDLLRGEGLFLLNTADVFLVHLAPELQLLLMGDSSSS